ncbi:hypothetical protein F4703DRAFT_1847103 [Phycomyces blakesleeanus]
MHSFYGESSDRGQEDPCEYAPCGPLINDAIVWGNATMRGWIIKHQPPSFSFTSHKKPRYVILADRYLYTFKTDHQTDHYKEFLELTRLTHVFVTDQFAGVPHCIEIRKMNGESYSWFIQAPDGPTLMLWLERLKKTLFWLASTPPLTPVSDEKNSSWDVHSSHSSYSSWSHSPGRTRLPIILPPQPPPPTTKLPPIPSEYAMMHLRNYR